MSKCCVQNLSLDRPQFLSLESKHAGNSFSLSLFGVSTKMELKVTFLPTTVQTFSPFGKGSLTSC